MAVTAAGINVSGSNISNVKAGFATVELSFTDAAAATSGAVTPNKSLDRSYKSVRCIATGVSTPAGSYAAASASVQVVDTSTVAVAYTGPAGAKYSVTLECEV
jgi:hypothetical protein